ncbi:MAG: helix-turn-helix domain-containing protein [Pseudomonadota bacterium]
MEKVSIARRRQSMRLMGGETRSPHASPLSTPPVKSAPPVLEGGFQQAVNDFMTALKQCLDGDPHGLGVTLEVGLAPDDPGRLRIQVITEPVRHGRFLSVHQASRLLRVGPRAVRRALSRGQLQGIRIGREWRVCFDAPCRPTVGAPPGHPQEG